LSAARKQLGDGGERIRYLFPPIVIQAVKLARRFKRLQDTDEGWERKCSTLFKFIHQIISILHNKVDNPESVLRLFLLAGQSADECGFEDICYEFFVQVRRERDDVLALHSCIQKFFFELNGMIRCPFDRPLRSMKNRYPSPRHSIKPSC